MPAESTLEPAHSDNRHVRADQLIGLLGLLAVGMSWLIPNKNFPWLSAWNEGAAFAGGLFLAGAAIVVSKRNPNAQKKGVPWPLTVFVLLSLATVWVQWLAGLLLFHGDAFMVTLYLVGFWLAIYAGIHLAQSPEGDSWMVGLATTILMAGVVTVGMMLVQWTQVYSLVVFVQETGIGARPFANLGQINHINTLLFMACCALMYLGDQKKIHMPVVFAGLAYLTLGMALTQSRTAWVQVGACIVYSCWMTRSLTFSKNRYTYCLAALYFGWVLAMPAIMNGLQLAGAREVNVSGTLHDLRRYAWLAMGDAILKRPLAGWGWLQNASAQLAVAMNHPPLRYEFNYSHNLILDLLLWCGLPIGGILVALLALWGIKHLFVSERNVNFMMAMLMGIAVHCLLEYPFAYAYFLIPAGLIAGFVECQTPKFSALEPNPPFVMGIASAFLILFAKTGAEVISSIAADTALRTEAAKIGLPEKKYDPPKLVVLDQLGALLKFRSIEPRPKMTQEELALMERVAHRYIKFAILADLAYAKGLNNNVQAQNHYIDLGCAIYGETRCIRDMRDWSFRRTQTGGRIDIYYAPQKNEPIKTPLVQNKISAS